jgi:hypothetical protein
VGVLVVDCVQRFLGHTVINRCATIRLTLFLFGSYPDQTPLSANSLVGFVHRWASAS